jgi:hypothetical protein
MNIYVFQGARWCEDCGLAIRNRLLAAHKAPRHPDDESTYTSAVYPAGPAPAPADHIVQHCAGQDACLQRVQVGRWPDGRPWYIGAWLENPLTATGRRGLAAEIRRQPQHPLIRLWAEWYADVLHPRARPRAPTRR